jgi:hypothetical protein
MPRKELYRRAAILCRRLFTGMVMAYALTCLCAGGTRAADPIFDCLAIAWGLGVVGLEARGVRRVHHDSHSPAIVRAAEIVITNVAVCLVLVEIALRVYCRLGGMNPLVEQGLEGYRLTPGREYGLGIPANRHGYPGREFHEDKTPGTRCIAALGDSFAVGPAVAYGDNYLNLLEMNLPHTEVYNFGVSGTGPREYLAILRREVWTYHADLVLVSVFVGNDITELAATPRHFDPRRQLTYLLVSRGWRLAREHWRKSDATRDAGAPAVLPLSQKTFAEIEARRLEVCRVAPPASLERKWRRTLDDLGAIAADCRRHQVPCAFVLIPDEFQVNRTVLDEALALRGLTPSDVDLELPQRRLLDFCASRSIACLDLLPVFKGVMDTYAPRDTHWNAKGNRLAAQEVARWLAKLGRSSPE